MTIDEAISHALEVAERYERMEDSHDDKLKEECLQCAADHRQLAEWLTDYKELKNSIGAAKFSNMKEALELIREYKAENIAQKKLIAEYKRLLKAAVEDMTGIQFGEECKVCSKKLLPNECPIHNNVACILEKDFKWRYADEALALIGEDINVPASADDTNVGHKSGGWISCKDRMPEVNEPVLFIFNTESGFKAVMYGWHETIKGLGSGWHQAGVGGARADEEVTHWQPLPEPPKDGDT